MEIRYPNEERKEILDRNKVGYARAAEAAMEVVKILRLRMRKEMPVYDVVKMIGKAVYETGGDREWLWDVDME